MLKTILKIQKIPKKKTTKKKYLTNRTLGQMVKAKLYRQNHTEKHTHTYLQKEEKQKSIYIIAPNVHHLNFGMIRCLFRYSKDVGFIKFLWRFNPLLLRLLGEISLSLLRLHSSWDSVLDLAPTSACRLPEGTISSLRQNRVKVAAD